MRNFAEWGMLMNSCKIKGFGYALAKHRVTNEELSRHVETDDEWIVSRTGIKARYLSEIENTSDLGYRAARMALEHAAVNDEEIDLIICATFTPDYTTPSTACLIQEKLGMNKQRMMAFDLNAACSGFLYALETAHALLDSGFAKGALIIGSEVISKQLNWRDRSTCILFGDGAGAVVLKREPGMRRMLHFAGSQGDASGIIHSDAPQPRRLFDTQKAGNSYVEMNGSEVFRFAVKAMQESMEMVLKQADQKFEEIDWIVPHQANKRIIDRVCRRCGIDEKHVYMNIEEFGNTSAASIPLALAKMDEAGLLKDGMKLVLSGFGAGFTWAGTYLEL